MNSEWNAGFKLHPVAGLRPFEGRYDIVDIEMDSSEVDGGDGVGSSMVEGGGWMG